MERRSLVCEDGSGQMEVMLTVQQNVKSLCLCNPHAMGAYGGVELELYELLTSVLGGGKWTTLRPVSFSPRRKDPGIL